MKPIEVKIKIRGWWWNMLKLRLLSREFAKLEKATREALSETNR
jgi:hypothetical protein